MSTPASVGRETFKTGGDLLNLIDERFAELEEQVSLAHLIPQLHDRLVVMEEQMKQLQDQGFLIHSSRVDVNDFDSPSFSKPLEFTDFTVNEGPKWSEEDAPSPLQPPDDDDDDDMDPKVEAQSSLCFMIDLKSLPAGLTPKSLATALSPTRRRSTQGLSKPPTQELGESLLDVQTQEYYTFGESTWDLVFFIGTGALGPLGSVQTFLLAVVNVVMQVVFVAIAYFNFTTPQVDASSVEEAIRWRRSSGQAMSSYSPLAKESLAERVCKMDKSLEQSGIQVALYENIESYLKSGRDGFESYFTGQMLCLVALICWYLMVAKEVSHALALHRGIVAVPSGKTKIDTRENPFTQVRHYRLKSVARRRKLFSAILLAYRIFAAILLVWVGTFFLVYTVDVTELILNAVALGIILDIDDLLFDALATTPGRHLVHQLDALPMPAMPRIRGADAKSAFMSIAIPVLSITVYFTMLQPMVDTLHDVSFAMCGGNKAFVWNLDPRGVVLLSDTPGGGWEEDQGIKNFAVEEAEKVGFGLQRSDSKYGVWVGDVSVLTDASIMTLTESVDVNNPDCSDLVNGALRHQALNFLRFAHQNESIQGCEDVVHACGSLTQMPDFGLDGGKGWATRMFCSETCGCQEPAGQIAVQGCPYGPGRACQATDRFDNVTKESLCIEKSAASLQSSVDWTNWIKAIRSYGESAADLPGKSDAVKIADAMWDCGCDFGANLSAENVYWGNCFGWNSTFEFEFKTVEVFCPLTCQCSSANLGSGCPKPFGYACDQLSSKYCLTLNDQHYCPGFTPTLELTLSTFMQTRDYDLVDSIWNEIVAAYKDTLLWLTDLPDLSQFRFFANRVNRQIYFRFFFYEVDDTVKVKDIDTRFFAPRGAEIEGNLTEKMQLRNLPVDVLQVSVFRRGYGNEQGVVFSP